MKVPPSTASGRGSDCCGGVDGGGGVDSCDCGAAAAADAGGAVSTANWQFPCTDISDLR